MRLTCNCLLVCVQSPEPKTQPHWATTTERTRRHPCICNERTVVHPMLPVHSENERSAVKNTQVEKHSLEALANCFGTSIHFAVPASNDINAGAALAEAKLPSRKHRFSSLDLIPVPLAKNSGTRRHISVPASIHTSAGASKAQASCAHGVLHALRPFYSFVGDRADVILHHAELLAHRHRLILPRLHRALQGGHLVCATVQHLIVIEPRLGRSD